MGEKCKLGFSLSRSGFDPDLQLLLRFCGTGFWVFLLTKSFSVMNVSAVSQLIRQTFFLFFFFEQLCVHHSNV